VRSKACGGTPFTGRGEVGRKFSVKTLLGTLWEPGMGGNAGRLPERVTHPEQF